MKSHTRYGETMPNTITKLIVFSGAKEGNNPIYREEAARLGRLVGEQTTIRELVYGGGFAGLMGAFAAASARAGMTINGVRISAFMNIGAPDDVAPMYKDSVAEDLTRRKRIMLQEGEAALVLPGGIGTFDELWEIVAEQDVNFHANPDAVMQPVLLLNINGYYDGMIAQIRKAVEEGFIDPVRARFIAPVNSPEEAVTLLNKINQNGRWNMREFIRPSATTPDNPFYVPPPGLPPVPPAP